MIGEEVLDRMPGETLLWSLGKKFLAPYILSRFHIQSEGSFPSPPFLLVANHLSAFDPFLITALSPYPVVWVANQLIFQHPFLGPLIRGMGALPKRKAVPDPQVVLKMMDILEKGGVIGLFPEGSVTWDGVSQGVVPSTEKFLARLQVPVVFARIQGTWMRKPIWAKHARRGLIRVSFTLLSPLSLASFYHSEWDWQRENGIPFEGERSAEGIERVVFFCPSCGSFRSVRGRGREVVCRECKRSWHIDAYGFIQGETQREFTEGQDFSLSPRCAGLILFLRRFLNLLVLGKRFVFIPLRMPFFSSRFFRYGRRSRGYRKVQQSLCKLFPSSSRDEKV